MFRLDDKHLEAAQQIAARHRRKKSCGECYDRGWIGTTDQNLLVLCTRCVDMDAAIEEWKAYVGEHEELKEHFSELFEEKKIEEAETAHVVPEKREHHKDSALARNAFVPGQKRTGHQKKIG